MFAGLKSGGSWQNLKLEAMEETRDPPIRIMNFVSEDQVNQYSKSQAPSSISNARNVHDNLGFH